MAACDHWPCAGDSDLGVRSGIDVHPDEQGMVWPLRGGMSVAPDDPGYLPLHRRPPSLGGTGKRPVWKIQASTLPACLSLRLDRSDHGLIEPTEGIVLEAYRDNLFSTHRDWTLDAV